MSKRFERSLQAATDSTILETDWDAVLDCVDQIRGGEARAKDAMAALQKRLNHENPYVQLHALTLLEAVVKNCGRRVHSELATREFMEDIKNLASESKADPVKNKVLELLQCWAMAFANKPEYKIIGDTHNLMKLAGFEFPSVKEADAMFASQVAPEWEEGPNCFRCRSEFGLLTRKHHCRACGQIFCASCSNKEMLLPQFGIEKPVRVCEACFERGVGVAVGGRPPSTVRVKEPLPPTAGGQDPSAEDRELQEKRQREKDEEEYQMQLALAISQSEAEAKEAERQNSLYSLYNGVKNQNQIPGGTGTPHHDSSVTPTDHIGIYKGAADSVRESPSDVSVSADDPLARYLNRDYWQQKKSKADAKVEQWEINPSAPLPSEPSLGGSCAPTVRDSPVPAASTKENVFHLSTVPALDEETSQKSDETIKFCADIKEQVESMENRIRSNVARGRPIYNDTAIQGLYMRLTELHAHVMQRMNDLENQRAFFESLQDHLSHISEARGAINALREEEERKRAEIAAEEQRSRQSQMQHKLAAMRQQKHDMLLYQRQVALQRFQQQEAEMAARRQQMQPQQPNYYPYQLTHQSSYGAQVSAVAPASQQGYTYGQQPAQYSTTGAYAYGGSQAGQGTAHSNITSTQQHQQANYHVSQQSATDHCSPQNGYGQQNGAPLSTQSVPPAAPSAYAMTAPPPQPPQAYGYSAVPASALPYGGQAHGQPSLSGYESHQYAVTSASNPPHQQYYQHAYQAQPTYAPTGGPAQYPVQAANQAEFSAAAPVAPPIQSSKEEMLISFD